MHMKIKMWTCCSIIELIILTPVGYLNVIYKFGSWTTNEIAGK